MRQHVTTRAGPMTSHVARVAVPSRDTLSRRASLTFLSGLLQSGARLAVGMLLTPLLVRELGAVLYGAWIMIQQGIGWLALTDMRPMGTLKFTLAVEQHLVDDARKRRQVGAALRLWAYTLPVTILVAAIATWWAPAALQLSGAEVSAVRLALLLTCVGVLLDRVLGLPASVLRGVNLDYKGAWWATATILLSAVLTVVALRAGFGLPGVALVSVTSVLLGSGARFLVARRHVSWLGAERPSHDEFRRFTRLSAWLLIGSLGTVLFLSSDLLITGMVLGPAAAAVYATTGAALRLASEPLFQLVASGNAGVAALCGRQEWARVSALREEMWLAAVGSMTVIGVAVIVLNRAFLTLWLGPEYHAGLVTTALLVLLALQGQLFRVETVVADAMMLMQEKGKITLAAGILGAVCGATAGWRFGLPGMAAGTLAGRSLALVLTPRLLARRLPMARTIGIPLRTSVASLALLALAALLSSHVNATGWLELVALGASIVPVVAALWFFGALEPSARRVVRDRLASLTPRRR